MKRMWMWMKTKWWRLWDLVRSRLPKTKTTLIVQWKESKRIHNPREFTGSTWTEEGDSTGNLINYDILCLNKDHSNSLNSFGTNACALFPVTVIENLGLLPYAFVFAFVALLLIPKSLSAFFILSIPFYTNCFFFFFNSCFLTPSMYFFWPSAFFTFNYAFFVPGSNLCIIRGFYFFIGLVFLMFSMTPFSAICLNFSGSLST